MPEVKYMQCLMRSWMFTSKIDNLGNQGHKYGEVQCLNISFYILVVKKPLQPCAQYCMEQKHIVGRKFGIQDLLWYCRIFWIVGDVGAIFGGLLVRFQYVSYAVLKVYWEVFQRMFRGIRFVAVFACFVTQVVFLLGIRRSVV